MERIAFLPIFVPIKKLFLKVENVNNNNNNNNNNNKTYICLKF